MTEAVDTATTTASGTESATSEAQASQQQAAEQGQQQQAQAQQQEQKPAVPDAYKFESLPEGYDFSAEAQAEWSGVFKELGLTQEQASKLVEMDAKRQASGAQASEQAAIEFRNQQVSKWESELKQDAAFGGANFEANVGIAQKALADYGTPELTAMLKESGLGSHPEVVRFFHRVGQELAEGKLHRTTTEVPTERSLAERMYPNYPA
ncbi:hypothetical protein ACVSNG_22870 [Pseudomonas aeruginosa]|uniref:hypothetical protein n=1 Tax=Pseudomonas aeruginosa TaxID=287 RepID=UPI0003D32D96|nr:hypothetical protein [Pseudomonas aeruginosa]EKT9084015.1 hypothetical protein [Pseudomonas aeruginosa]EKU6906229.1 hypothetical protein [Pseudomonas aeruginosa]EKW9782498.1 hypothetical protein [Pseudomonas aeruginosa]ELL0588150.1 hypothetical protein [Pseudomonas aeruginosa]ELN8195057.1 hypothetical protein [Pseudomonas aeruginosa]